MTTSNLYTTSSSSSRSSSTLAALTTMAATTLKVVAALNNSVTTVAALAVAGTTGALATYMAESQHSSLTSSAYAHPYHSSYTAGNNTAIANGNTNINKILYHNTNNSSNNNSITDNSSTLNVSNYNSSISLLAPALNMTHSHFIGSLHNVNSTLIGGSGSGFINNNNSLVDGLMVDHLPLQLITSTASSKGNLDIEIDIQLLTSDYEGSTITTYFNETSWINPSETDTIVGIFLSVLIFLSIAGNILVCLAIYTERSLRRIGNLFLASLAIADLFVASLVMTFAGVNDLLGYWIFGAQFCDTWVAFDVMCSTASILNLCAISLDRYIHIKDPLRYGRWVTRRVAVVTIAAIWLLAAFVSFVPISLGLHRPDQPLIVEDNGKKYPTCALDLTPTYAVVSSCISFYFPCVVMIGIYCRLYCYAQKHVKSIKAVTRPGEVAEKQRYKSIRRTKPQEKKKFKVRNLHHSSPYHVSDHKAAVTVGVIMGVFLICWVPFFCVNIVAAFCKTCIGGQTFKILSWLGYSNSAFNPIIYSIFNKEFRDAFKRILTTRNPWCCNQDIGNIHPRNSDRFVTDYASKHVVAMNSGRSSAEMEQVSAI
ncbi:dopamine receptor 1 isoform X2 [Lucilia cuprina]|uniref:dopamine receptor 1 isoform X2 n=1 Tax=Lucilia cuprina TaxID=7375 RepID=UPI001F05279C|nr:dopamine receptor 1 isoform X2 [Lucilia cuprina]